MGAARTVALTGSDQQVRSGAGTYRGIVLRETAGAVASFRLFDGTSAAGTLVDAGNVAAGGNYVRDTEIHFATGLFLDVVAGTVEGSVLIG